MVVKIDGKELRVKEGKKSWAVWNPKPKDERQKFQELVLCPTGSREWMDDGQEGGLEALQAREEAAAERIPDQRRRGDSFCSSGSKLLPTGSFVPERNDDENKAQGPRDCLVTEMMQQLSTEAVSGCSQKNQRQILKRISRIPCGRAAECVRKVVYDVSGGRVARGEGADGVEESGR